MNMSREIRDMVYVELLCAPCILIAPSEHISCTGLPLTVTLSLLEVNHKIKEEAALVFYGRNCFKISSAPALNRASVFTSCAELFRKIKLELCGADCEEHFPFVNGESTFSWNCDLPPMWSKQIQSLAPMINLNFLELDVSHHLYEVRDGYSSFKRMTITMAIIEMLKPDLLTSLAQGVWRKHGRDRHGLWITGRFDYQEKRVEDVGEALQIIGPNFKLMLPYLLAVSPLFDDLDLEFRTKFYGLDWRQFLRECK